jgi:hypothetical protein
LGLSFDPVFSGLPPLLLDKLLFVKHCLALSASNDKMLNAGPSETCPFPCHSPLGNVEHFITPCFWRERQGPICF